MTTFTCTPVEAEQNIIHCLTAEEGPLVPFLQSSPGQGKSAIVRKIAQDHNLKLIDIRLSQSTPEDLMGLPMKVTKLIEDDDGNTFERTRAQFVPFGMFPLDSDPLPRDKKGRKMNGWLLFLDEFNSASKMVQAASYKLALDREVDQEKLHPSCFIVCAGNLEGDRAIVNRLSTAMQSRLIHIEMVGNHLPSFRDHALKAGFDSRVLGFLEFQPGKLNTFSPDHNDKTFACSRTWEFVSRLIKGKKDDEIPISLLAGAIGEGVAVEFAAFLREFSRLPSYQKILDDPENHPIPEEASTRYAAVTMLIDKMEKADFDKVVAYNKRMPPEIQVVFFRGINQRDPSVREHPAYAKSIRHLSKFLYKDDEAMTTAA